MPEAGMVITQAYATPARPARSSGHAGQTGRKNRSSLGKKAGKARHSRPPKTGHPPLCGAVTRFRKTAGLERPPEIMRNLADHAAAERQHAGDEDDALDHRHPLAETGQILLHGDDTEGAADRAGYPF